MRKEQRMAMVILVVTLLFLAGGVILLQQQRAELFVKQQQAGQNQQEILQIENFMNAHLQEEDYAAELKKREQVVQEQLPESMEQGRFLSLLQQEALRHGVVLAEVRPGSARSTERFAELAVETEICGSYFQVLDFLEAMEQSGRFLRIENTKVKSENGLLHCRILFKIYAMKA